MPAVDFGSGGWIDRWSTLVDELIVDLRSFML